METDTGMAYQLNMFKGAPDDESIKMIQYFEGLALENDPRGYCVCTSEGKDSRVLGHLFRRAGVKHFYLHSITGIDPPELIYFQRGKFQEYKDAGYLVYDVMYRLSMYQLMLQRRFPPLRRIRYCCSELKERRSIEQGKAVLSFGVRRHESAKRKTNRREMEIVNKKGYIVMPYDNTDNRRTFETCYETCEKRLNPIAEWETESIWSYIRYWRLDQCIAYQEGFDRLGCIGCPQASEKEREKEFRRWPGFKKYYLKAFAKMIEERKRRGMVILNHGQTAQDWFDWWMSDRAANDKDEAQYMMELSEY